ncbi:DUF3152 domain-containing protein [Streptomyces sp. NPDC015171]|uniref:DUF3152 domain-containing protein n=1 Tax=Streptomyces sp. NPDC015171 TaxID=3364945 RepID=UPI0036F751CA
MGRHSRRGPAPKSGSADITAGRGDERGSRSDGRGTRSDGRGAHSDSPGDGTAPAPDGASRAPEGASRNPDGTPRVQDGTPAPGLPRRADHLPRRGTQGAQGAQGGPGVPGGGSGPAVLGFPDGTPARGVSRFPDGTPGQGVPRVSDDAPARGVRRSREGAGARGGHPEQREAGGGWGEFAGRPGDAGGPGAVLPRQRQAGPDGPGVQRGPGGPGGSRRGRGPRQEYLEAFDGDGDGDGDRDGGRDGDGTADAGGPRSTGVLAADAGRARRTGDRPAEAPQVSAAGADGGAADGAALPAQRGGNKGWAFTGIAAAAITTVLAVIVAGQVTDARDDGDAKSQSAGGHAPDAHASGAPAPSTVPSAAPLTYDQKMGKKYPLSATLAGSGKFDAVPGFDKAPGVGQKYRYRVDVEQGLGLDGALFAEAVQQTLNDKRSWAHGGARTFERISSGKPDFVITLASPGTTAKWCAKSGLDTTEDNVSCDSAATERVMINAYRWAQGSKTYGDRIHPYRQMLINHEVGHRLGHGHVTCEKDGELAPVMQQQTKFLDHDGIHCRPNPWPYPGS